MTKHFHFNLGPVQGFVAQARRTRDFWAGSFLLSYLTAVAIKATKSQETSNKIVLPATDNDPMLARLDKNSGEGPQIGSLPNCFTASVTDSFDGAMVVSAVQEAWEAVADSVWKGDYLGKAGVNDTLWNTQIGKFWDITWVMSDSEDGEVMAMRKNWRSHYPPEQYGDKCSVMGEWQELSGQDRPHRNNQNEFWKNLKSTASISTLELRDKERLCAIAYVKRRFVKYWPTIEDHRGWSLPSAVPSTSYLAAAHWIDQVQEHVSEELIKQFYGLASTLVEHGELKTTIPIIKKNAAKHGKFSSLDGRVFFRSSLESDPELDADTSRQALEKLNEIAKIETAPGKCIGHPSPFYALLMMDGDNLGETKKAMKGNVADLSAALNSFTESVHSVVSDHNGFLIYAGGDDVLALLPLENALSCALKLRKQYMQVFEKKSLEAGTYSISAGLIYAHMKLPLTMILKDAHSLLDDVAKEQTGRDAIAIRVWKPGGEISTWTTQWGKESEHVEPLEQLAEEFRKDESEEPGHASKPLYRMRERLTMLKGSGFDARTIEKLLVAEYETSGVLSQSKRKQQIAQSRVSQLLPLCKSQTSTDYDALGLMLLRFLAQKGVER